MKRPITSLFIGICIISYVILIYGNPACFNSVCTEHIVVGGSGFMHGRSTIYTNAPWAHSNVSAASFRESIKNLFSDDLQRETFTSKHVRIERPNGAVEFQIPVTGEASIDGALRSFVETFAYKRSGADGLAVSYNTSGEYISVVVASLADADFDVQTFSREGVTDISKFLTGDNVQRVIDVASDRLSQQMQLQLEKSRPAVMHAVENKKMRIADNGIVVLVDSKEISKTYGTPYHEVLAPQDLVGPRVQ